MFRDSRPYSAMSEDNSTKYLKEMTLLLREQFPYSSIYPVLGDMDFSPPSQAKPMADPMYKVAAELWGTWLPPKAIDSLKHGEFQSIRLKRNSFLNIDEFDLKKEHMSVIDSPEICQAKQELVSCGSYEANDRWLRHL